LYVLLARAARRAVVFRRGPSKQVLLLSWNLDTDRLREGQWLKGRIYERRCDLSPSGERMVYFAASQKPPYRTWTAVSRPPWLTALALWAKGDTWGGGGLFLGENVIELADPRLHVTQGVLPRFMAVRELGGDAEALRRQRDGWVLVSRGQEKRLARGFALDPPQIWQRESPRGRAVLEERLHALGAPNEAWTKQTYSLSFGKERHDLGPLDWADWDATGDLLLARDGKLIRLERRSLRDPTSGREVSDLSDLKFTARRAPESALRW